LSKKNKKLDVTDRERKSIRKSGAGEEHSVHYVFLNLTVTVLQLCVLWDAYNELYPASCTIWAVKTFWL